MSSSAALTTLTHILVVQREKQRSTICCLSRVLDHVRVDIDSMHGPGMTFLAVDHDAILDPTTWF